MFYDNSQKSRAFWLLALGFFVIISTDAQTKLMMIGGGKRPNDVLEKFAQESGNGKILVITWATSVPEASFNAIKKDFAKASDVILVTSPTASEIREKKEQFFNMLEEASAVYFTGGDQNRITEVLEDKEIYEKLHQKYNDGYIFGGTSAGTAIMSEIMITGKGNFSVINKDSVATTKGLGLVKNMIADQHFIKRKRQNRLLSLILKYPQLYGVGIDEDTALYLENGKFATVYGDSQVIVYKPKKGKEISQVIICKGQQFKFR